MILNESNKRTRILLGVLAVLILVASVFAMYAFFLQAPYWPKLIGNYDWWHYFGPQAYYMDSVIHNGEVPLWNPLSFCGQPFAANPQVTAFYPPNLIRSLLTFEPTPWRTHLGLALMMVLHMAIAGMGTFWLARDYKLSWVASLVAALAYIFGPHFVRRVLEQWVLVAVATWLPFILLFAKRAMESGTARKRVLYALLGALAFSLATLAGFPQVTFYTVLTMAFFVLLNRLCRPGLPRLSSFRTLGREYFTDAWTMALLFIAAALLAMVLLLPASEFIRATSRIASSGVEVRAAPQDLSAKHLFESMIVYPGATREEPGCRGAGLGVVLLAIAAAFYRSKRPVILYAALFVVLTDCTLGPPFPFGHLVYKTDFLQFSSPWRAGIIEGFPLAMLAAFGVDAAVDRARKVSWRILRTVFLAAVAAILLYYLWAWIKHSAYLPVTWSVVYIPMLMAATLVLAAWAPPAPLWRVALLALVFAEMFAWNRHFVPQFVQERGFKMGADTVAGGQPFWNDNRRGADPLANYDFYNLEPAMNGYDPICLDRVRRHLCDANKEKGYTRRMRDWEVTSENTRGSLHLKRSLWLARQGAQGPIPGKKDLYPPTTTVFLDRPPSGGVPMVEAGAVPRHAVSDNVTRIPVTDAATLAKLVQRGSQNARKPGLELPPVRIDGVHSALCLLIKAPGGADMGFTFRDPANKRQEYGRHTRVEPTPFQEKIIEIPLPDFETVYASVTWKPLRSNRQFEILDAYVLQDLDDENRLIEITRRTANTLEAKLIDLPDKRILVFIDAAYPGWQAQVNGQEVPILTADEVFKAIEVPAGSSTIRFEYHSWRTSVGAAISLLALLAILIWVRMIVRSERAGCHALDS